MAEKTVNMQFSMVTCTPLQEFLQNGINFRLFNRSKTKSDENNVLLQELHQIAPQITKIAVLTQDFTASSIFCRFARRRFPASTFSVDPLPQSLCNAYETPSCLLLAPGF
ncbi:hypothetical protein [Paenibacillus dendritiformis]|uniref:hypothetical protein n=1 Tax=Paenibacillus dendritiformis TaxID=130049 RepID=UPI0020C49A3A|nr:hypothetical protein [Paenibacillus dendritiformis]CAH8772699.1 hypothetical protein H7S4_005440 [Paenibacillus dendritiformis]